MNTEDTEERETSTCWTCKKEFIRRKANPLLKFPQQNCDACCHLYDEMNDPDSPAYQMARRRDFIANQKKKCGIPERYRESTLENYIVECDGQRIAKERCEQWIENVDVNVKGGISLIFLGSVGTGKTHLACALGWQAIKSAHSVRFVTAASMLSEIRATYSDSSKEDESQAISRFTKVKVLLLDEVWPEAISPKQWPMFFEILNKRYENKLPTIMTTNLSPDALRELLSERLVSRLSQGESGVVEFNWGDERKK